MNRSQASEAHQYMYLILKQAPNSRKILGGWVRERERERQRETWAALFLTSLSGNLSPHRSTHAGERVLSPGKRHRLLDALDQEQRDVIDAVLDGRNVFFTGKAGTGKSYLLRTLLQVIPVKGKIDLDVPMHVPSRNHPPYPTHLVNPRSLQQYHHVTIPCSYKKMSLWSAQTKVFTTPSTKPALHLYE